MNPGTDEPQRPLRVVPAATAAIELGVNLEDVARDNGWRASPTIMKYAAESVALLQTDIVARTGSGTKAVREVVARAIHALIVTVPAGSPLTEQDVIAGLLDEAAARTKGAPDLRADTTALWEQRCPVTHEGR